MIIATASDVTKRFSDGYRSTTPQAAWGAIRKIVGLKDRSGPADVMRTLERPAAVDRVSIEIESGTVTCLTGPGGSGKSTLLRLMGGVLTPTSGRIELRGRPATLLAVDESLTPDLPARENIERERRLLGMPDTDQTEFEARVFKFADLAGFEDVEVGRYSTGMQMRLGMALALASDAPFLVIDDVLGVGDIAFREKCIDKLLLLKARGRTILLTTLDDGLIDRLADRVVTMEAGRIVRDTRSAQSPAAPAVEVRAVRWQTNNVLPQNDVVALESFAVSLADAGGDHPGHIVLEAIWRPKRWPQRARANVDVRRGEKLLVFRSLAPRYHDVIGSDHFVCRVDVPLDLLAPGAFSIDLNMVSLEGPIAHSLKARNAIQLQVEAGQKPGSGSEVGLTTPNLAWEHGAIEHA